MNEKYAEILLELSNKVVEIEKSTKTIMIALNELKQSIQSLSSIAEAAAIETSVADTPSSLLSPTSSMTSSSNGKINAADDDDDDDVKSNNDGHSCNDVIEDLNSKQENSILNNGDFGIDGNAENGNKTRSSSMKSVTVITENGDVGADTDADTGVEEIEAPNSKQSNNSQIIIPKNFNFTLSFVNSSRNFYLFINYEQLVTFYSEMNNEYYNLDKNTVKIKTIDDLCVKNKTYIAFHQETESYYRCSILDLVNSETIKIIFIDYGEHSVIEMKNLFELLPKYAKQPPFAANCFINGNWDRNMKLYESALIKYMEQVVEMHANMLEPIDNCKRLPVKLEMIDGDKLIDFFSYDHKVEIYDYIEKYEFDFNDFTFEISSTIDWKRLAELYKLLYEMINYQSKFNYQNIKHCWLFKILDLNNFLIVKGGDDERKFESLNYFVTNISNFYYESNDDFKFTNGKQLQNANIVIFQHGQYYFRGLLLSKIDNEKSYEIFAFDINLILNVPSNQIYRIMKMFSIEEYPPFIHYCTINNIKPFKRETWPSMAIKAFHRFNNQLMNVKIHGITNGKLDIDLNDSKNNNLDVRTYIIRLRLGVNIE